MYTVHVISQNIDGGGTEADGGASAPVWLRHCLLLQNDLCSQVSVYKIRSLQLSEPKYPYKRDSLWPLLHLST